MLKKIISISIFLIFVTGCTHHHSHDKDYLHHYSNHHLHDDNYKEHGHDEFMKKEDKITKNEMKIIKPTLVKTIEEAFPEQDNSVAKNKNVIVVKGDTIIGLLKEHSGDYSNYELIFWVKKVAELNNIENPDLIFPKQEIIIPKE